MSYSTMINAINQKLIELKEKHSVDPIAFSKDVPSAPLNTTLQHKKVSIVGCGQVGMAIAFAMLNQETAGTIALYDISESKLEGELMDLQQGSAFHRRVRIIGASDYSVTNDSHLVIITAGAAQRAGESRLSLVERNTAIMKSILPQVLEHSPNAAICIVANPCDVMTAVAAKIAGPKVPAGRIFGSGTCLDSSRLQSIVAKGLDTDANAVDGFVIGEHGDSSVPVWSSVRVGGVPLLATGETALELQSLVHRYIVESAGEVIKRKGCTNWAVGLALTHIATAVLNDMHNIMPVSTCVRGLQGIEEDVFLSVPCSISALGVGRVVNVPLSQDEAAAFKKSAATVWEIQKGVWNTL